MIYPSLGDLMKKVDSRYSLVVATAKRAREIQDGSPVLIKFDSDKPVTLAINEIYQCKITISTETVKAEAVAEEYIGTEAETVAKNENKEEDYA